MGMIWIFGGTSEGRKLAEYCAENHLPVMVSVATEYGEAVLLEDAREAFPGEILQGRMEEAQMRECIQNRDVELVIDATHPYAEKVTEHIRRVCEQEEIEYLRVLRDPAEGADSTLNPDSENGVAIIRVDSVSAAINWLSDTRGNIMLTTGSKDLPAFCEQLDRKRLFPRVLPLAESLGICEANGIAMSHCIAMQGPFTEAVNLALLQQFDCCYLVTKESGKAGGLEEKLSACKKAGVTAIVIGRPAVEQGIRVWKACEYLAQRYGLETKKKLQIDIVGIGMGNDKTMTEEVRQTIHSADVLIGGKRMLEPYQNTGKVLIDRYQAEEIRRFIDACQEKADHRRIAILMSGDVGFYSGTKKLLEALQEYEVKLHPGISSVVYMAARIGMAWQDMVLCSVHGRHQNVLAKIRSHETVFTLVGNGTELAEICRQILKAEMHGVEVYVGENLSYDSERIWHGTPQMCLAENFGTLCVAVFYNRAAQEPTVASSIPDEDWIRGKVPMTKEEIRTISISKLRLTKRAIVYDIGAGTGSVSVEAALAAEDGVVYAIEKKAEAAELIERNAAAFGVSNLHVIRGMAPDVLAELPVPTHAFIGGSSGNLEEIIKVLLAKNPMIRIVVNAIALETIAELTKLAQRYAIELVTVTVAKAAQAGEYHLMMGQNPVMIGTFQSGTAQKGMAK